MSTWIITGGAGFIGANFVHALLARRPERVVVVDKLTYAGHRESLTLAEDDARYSFVNADIADAPRMSALFREHQPQALINFAAESHVDRSIDGPEAFIHTNIVGTFRLLEVTREYLAEHPQRATEFRFLHVSTDEVFGSLGPEGFFTESTPYDPRSPYSASKAAADHLVSAYHHTYGVPTLVTNCSNNYGPFQYPEKLIPLMLLNALEGKPLPIYGDGANVRDWLFVEDHCHGLMLALDKGEVGHSYNFGGSAERTNLEVVDTLCTVLEELAPAAENPSLVAKGISAYEDLRHFVADRPGHDRRYAIDPSKARRELGFAPSVDFESGLRRTARWYLENARWCAAVQGGDDRARLGLARAGGSR